MILNFSVLNWDSLGEREKALEMCNDALDSGTTALESIEDDSDLTDATTLLELIKENVDMWEDTIFQE